MFRGQRPGLRHLVPALAMAFCLATAGARAETLERAMRSVVSVLPDWPANVRRLEEPEASGVVIGDGRTIMTAAHVIAKATAVRVRTRDGRILAANSLAIDRHTDIAVLAIDETLPPLEVAQTPPGLGDAVCSIGNAFGLGLSVTCGVVSGVHQAGVGFNRIEDFVQTDAAVNPGASGGALVTREGRLIGLLSAIFTKRSDANIGVNFAVAAPLALRVARDLKAKGRVAWLNAGLRLGKAPGKGATGRLAAKVRALVPDGVAQKAGLRVGDLIIRAGPRRIRKPADFTSALARVVAPAELPLVVLRAGNETTVTLEF